MKYVKFFEARSLHFWNFISADFLLAFVEQICPASLLAILFSTCERKTILISPTTTAEMMNDETTLPWYENLPAVAMDYKVHIDAGKEDCYFQFVNPGATFYVSFQVLRGGDGMAGFAVRHPSGAIVHPYQWKPHSEYQDENSSGGYYSVCIDNQFSRFAAKLVNLYLTVVRPEKLDAFTKELEEMDLSVSNFTESLARVQHNINEMLQHQHFSRGREARDYNLLLDNKSYVQNWSIVQICVIMITTATQVYFVRKLFDVKSRSRA